MSKFLLIMIITFTLNIAPARALSDNQPEQLSCIELSDILSSSDITFQYGGYTINSGDTVLGRIAITGGSLDIQSGGVLIGDAWVVNGRAVLTGRAKVQGSLYLVNSEQYISRLSGVTGDMVEYISECELDYERYRNKSEIEFIKIDDPASLRIEPSVNPGTPCRVDYNLLKAGLKRYNPKHEQPYIAFYSHLHIPAWKEEGGFLGFDAGVSIPVAHEKADLIIKAYKKTVTKDDWQLSRLENGFIVSMTGDDYADYFEVRGVELSLKLRNYESFEIEPSISFQRDVSLSARKIPSLLFPRDKFRTNPQIEEGDRLAARLELRFTTRDESGWAYGGWKLNLILEKGIADGPGDFSYTTFDIDFARYNEITRGLKLDFRGKFFSSFTRIPRQISRSVNGYGGIRGLDDFPFDPARGNRVALFSAELRKSIPSIPVLGRVCSGMDLLIFSDTGILAVAGDYEDPFDFGVNPGNRWKSTAGIGISAKSILPSVELYIAEEIESESFSPRLIFRARRAF